MCEFDEVGWCWLNEIAANNCILEDITYLNITDAINNSPSDLHEPASHFKVALLSHALQHCPGGGNVAT